MVWVKKREVEEEMEKRGMGGEERTEEERRTKEKRSG